jgi:hypothetical protein
LPVNALFFSRELMYAAGRYRRQNYLTNHDASTPEWPAQ